MLRPRTPTPLPPRAPVLETGFPDGAQGGPMPIWAMLDVEGEIRTPRTEELLTGHWPGHVVGRHGGIP